MEYPPAIPAHVSDAVICFGDQRQVVGWNPRAEQLFGIAAHHAIGRTLDQLASEQTFSGIASLVHSGFEGAAVQNVERSFTKPDGTTAVAEINIPRIEGDRLVTLIARDITATRSTQEALRKSEEHLELLKIESAECFRFLSEVVSIHVWTVRPNGEVDFANQECLDYLGLQGRPEALNKGWERFVHPDDLANALNTWRTSLATSKPYEAEFRLRRHDAEYRWFIVRARAMRPDNGEIVRWFGTSTDVHDLKTAQAEAERASRAKDAFLAALSHELRTPLTPVLMTAAALRGDARLPDEAREQLGMIERNIALEARLIDDLLDLTRITRGQLRLRSELCDAHLLIGLAFEIVRDDARAKGISLEPDLQAAHSGLVADPARFQQVIWNLLRNAVKFTPRDGRVTVRTTNEFDAAGEERLRIEVTDSGIGIEPSALETIFRPFEQGDAREEHRVGGMGLGLAIARAIVELHGGTITAQSEGRNLGATFVVGLPGATEAPEGFTRSPALFAGLSPIAPPGPENAASNHALRLLLVEDHDSTLQVLSRLLTRAGHQVATATTLAEALSAAKRASFDVVISDLGLPDGTGNELMEILRARYGLRGIALSGYGMEEDVVRSRQAGFATHLTKPVDFARLQRALEDVMSAEVAV